MKIKTITCHNVYNYGASLQAYSLQQYLINLGHDVEIINYIPEYLGRTYSFLYIPDTYKYYDIFSKSFFLRLAYAFKYNKLNICTRGRIKPFDSFTKEYLKVTKEQYKSIYFLRKKPPIADVYIAGSDQIWNPLLPNGRDSAFFLDFGYKKTKRISYAASIALPSLPEQYIVPFYYQLLKFDYISVREDSGKQILDEIGLDNIKVVLDPVFLLGQSSWDKLADKATQICRDSYILVYEVYEHNNQLKLFVKKIARKYNLKIVSINDSKKLDYADINVSNGGPLEFLALIRNADFVVANSFHATAFSLIFHKEIFVFSFNSGGSSIRIQNLLSSVGLTERFNPNISVDENRIEWLNVDKLLNIFIHASKQFINKCLCQNEEQ